MRVAIIRDADGLVVNVAEASVIEDVRAPDGCSLRDASAEPCGPGWVLAKDGTYAEPVPEASQPSPLDVLAARVALVEDRLLRVEGMVDVVSP